MGTALRLRSSVPLEWADGDATATFKLRHGETASFVLEDAGAHLHLRHRPLCRRKLQEHAQLLAQVD